MRSTGPIWQAARRLVAEYGLEGAYLHAFERSHPYTSFGADPDPDARMLWGKVATRIRWMHEATELQKREEARDALTRRKRFRIEVRS
jgi:hypothetical protein